MQEIEEFVEYIWGDLRGWWKFKCVTWIFKGVKRVAMLTKLGKSKQQIYRFLICTRYNGDNVRVYGRDFGVGKFKYANKNLKGAQWVAIAAKCRQKSKNAQI